MYRILLFKLFATWLHWYPPPERTLVMYRILPFRLCNLAALVPNSLEELGNV